jgi:multidrug efflux pump subunit AcrA (membrane-fusion protein)
VQSFTPEFVILKYFIPLFAVVGFGLGLYVVSIGAKPIPVAQPVVDPSRPPFHHYIAGAGIVEAATENIQISTPVPGMVTSIPVQVGQQVNAGDPLFQIDSRDQEAELKVREAALQLARAKLPEAQSNVDDAKQMYELYQAVSDPRAITKEELNKRKFGLTAAESRLAQSEADVASAEAQISQTKTEISRRIITAPVTGQVLQLKIHPGEYAQVGQLATPLIVMGETRQVNIRTDIDENDAWRFSPGARAIAYVRGNPDLSTTLKFVRVEPYVVPKMSLTGGVAERVDTRVLQVLFSFQRSELQVYVGQQMDVYIEVPDATGEASASALPATTEPISTHVPTALMPADNREAATQEVAAHLTTTEPTHSYAPAPLEVLVGHAPAAQPVMPRLPTTMPFTKPTTSPSKHEIPELQTEMK